LAIDEREFVLALGSPLPILPEYDQALNMRRVVAVVKVDVPLVFDERSWAGITDPVG
jgi:hypothetical protein